MTVRRSLGHAKATTTLNTYAHLWPTAEDRTRKAAESIMASSLGGTVATLADASRPAEQARSRIAPAFRRASPSKQAVRHSAD